MKASDVKHGQTVTAYSALDAHKRYVSLDYERELAGVQWTVLDRAPGAGMWYLHRWEGNSWISCYVRARDLELVEDPYRVGGKVKREALFSL